MATSYSIEKVNPKLLRRVYRACRPSNEEPNLSLNLEICDYVNAKGGSTARDAAIAVVKLISQRDPQTSELALSLLDNLVKNCGYPFHLQISRKEFLNELVKRFPERPPMRISRNQRQILLYLEEWYQTICKNSKYKDDFKYIKDMHRLLSNKGYIFPEVKIEDISVLNPSENLKTMEELKKEEEIVNASKLQELIRSGKPQDLQEANKIMKIMAGFRDDNLKENQKKLKEDILKLERKIEILNEMLDQIDNGKKTIGDDDEVVNQIVGQIKSSLPIIEKIINEEDKEDVESIDKILKLNDDSINVIQKYEKLKDGEIKTTKTTNKPETLNLIDFDDDVETSEDKQEQNFVDLLSDLTFNDNNNNNSTNKGAINLSNLYGSAGSINLNNSNLLADFNSPSPPPQLQSNLNTTLSPGNFQFPISTPTSIQSTFTKTISIHKSDLNLNLGVESYSSTNLQGQLILTANQNVSVSDVKLYLAVPKNVTLNLQPQSSDVLNNSNLKITQILKIENQQQKPLKIKFKIEYKLNNELKEINGVHVLNL
ncbi:unnamed protein product [Candida verbasci]|uniref:VHS domain-containing protein n=1 Tax=Candida verbasci TaxID=1227364 RepID=A0A9W4X9R1_9ASCO|nr:unnamed protein product [Candida verbasci]